MEDVADIKFEWNKAAVQRNLDEVYPRITIKDLNNYKTCGRKYTDISYKTHDKPDNRKDKTKTGPNSYFKLIFGMEKPPLDHHYCICGQYIQEQCYICPRDGVSVGSSIIVGNECVDKFTELSIKGRRCEVCCAIHKIETLIYVMNTKT